MEILNLLIIFYFYFIKSELTNIDNIFSSGSSSMQLSNYIKQINKQNELNKNNMVEISSIEQHPTINNQKVICDSMLGQVLVVVEGIEECQFVSNNTMQMYQMTTPPCIGIECTYVTKPQQVPILYKPKQSQVILKTEQNKLNNIKPIETNMYLKKEPNKIIIQTVTIKEKPETKIFKEMVPITITKSLPRETIQLNSLPQTIIETVSLPPIISTITKSINIPPKTIKIFEPPQTETIKEFIESPPITSTIFNSMPAETVSITIPPKTEIQKETIYEKVTSTIFNEMPAETVRIKIPAKTKFISQFIPSEPITSIITKKIIEPSETVTVENVKTVSVYKENKIRNDININNKIPKTVSVNNNSIIKNNKESIIHKQELIPINNQVFRITPSIISAGGIVSGNMNMGSSVFSNLKEGKIINRNSEYISCDSICKRNKEIKIVRMKHKTPSSCYTSTGYNNIITKKVKILNQPSIPSNGNITHITISTPQGIDSSINKGINSSALIRRSNLNEESETFRYDPEFNNSCIYSNDIFSNSNKFIRRNNNTNRRFLIKEKYKTINELKRKLDLIYSQFINSSRGKEKEDNEFVNYLFDSIYEKNEDLIDLKNEKTENFKNEIKNLLKNKQYQATLNKNKIVNNYLKTLINSSPIINNDNKRRRIYQESSFITERKGINELRKNKKIKTLKEILKRKLLLKRKLQNNEIFQRIKERNLLSRLVGNKIQKIKSVLKTMNNSNQRNLVDILLNNCNNFCNFDLERICQKYGREAKFCNSLNSSDDVVIFLSELVHS